MHAIGSEIMGDSEYLHEASALNTASQLDKRYLANIFCITVIKKLNERLGQIARTGVRI